jgi:hypothetical protein
MGYAVSIVVSPSRSDTTEALKEVVAEIRADVRTFFFRERVEPKEVKHLYARITDIGSNVQNKNGAETEMSK